MAEIRRDDILDPQVAVGFEELAKVMGKTADEIDVLIKKGIELSKVQKDIASSQKSVAKASEEVNKNAKETEVQTSKLNTIFQKNYDINKELEKQRTKQYTQQQKLTKVEQERTRALNSEAKTTLDLVAKNKALRDARDRVDITTRNGRKEIDKYNKEISKNNALIKKNVSSLEKQKIGIGGYTKSILGSLGIVSGLGMLANGIKGAIDKSIEFETALDELSAITGATGNDLEYLQIRAIELSKDTGKSAVEIVEAFKLVGSAKPELLSDVDALTSMTESVMTLSKASGMDLAPTTESLTKIMNQFGASADDADRYINTLAAGSKFGAVEVDYLADAMVKVGTVANAAGLNIEQTTAAMELFGEKGVRAEIAGNGFKSVLVELQKDTNNYTNGVFDLNKAIDNNKSISTDNIALQEKFGREYFSIAQILLTNKERFYELTAQVQGTNVAFEQAAINSDNTKTSLNRLSANWDALVLSIMNGEGSLGSAFKNLIDFINEAIEGIERLTNSTNVNKRNAIEQGKTNAKLFRERYNALSKIGMTEEEYEKRRKDYVKEREQQLVNELKLTNQKFEATKSMMIQTGEASGVTGVAMKVNAALYNKDLEEQKTALFKKSWMIKAELDEVRKLKEKESGENKKIADTEVKVASTAGKEKKKVKVKTSEEIVQEEMKLAERLKAFDDELEKEKKELRDKLTEEELNTQVAAYNARLAALKQSYAKGEMTEEQYSAAVIKASEDNLKAQIDNLKVLSEQTMFEGEAKEELLLKIAELERQLQDESLNNLIDINEKKREEEEKTNELRKKSEEELYEKKKELANEAFGFINTLFDRQLSNLEVEKANELALVGNNEDAKAAIEKKYADESLAIKRKQAIADKAQALFNIGLSTVEGVMKALATANIPLSIIIGTVGALQAATVLATPLPQFDKGVDNAPAGGFIAGEKRPEIMRHKGKYSLISEPTIFGDSFAGAKIIGGAETDRILRDGILSGLSLNNFQAGKSDEAVQLSAILSELKSNKEKVDVHFDSRGIQTIYQKQRFKNLRIDKYIS